MKNYTQRIIQTFNNKKILITGGTGSFGSTVLNRLIKYKFKEIIVFSRDERKQEELRLKINNSKVKFVIGDVREYRSIESAMKGVDYVFHAAALKQVPSCEFYPWEAYKTNIIGTENSVNSAIKNNVKKFILLSTDKAVYPINAMGMTKALAEKILQAKSRVQSKNKTILCITRYGNVMGSRASIIPRFYSLARQKKTLPITDYKMTRFLMSLEDSVSLVIHALLNGKQGEIFVQKSPACKITDLAKAVGKNLKTDIKTKVIGSRHGEKLNETLVSREEMLRAKDQKKYFKIITDNRDLNYDLFENAGNKKSLNLEDYNSENAEQLNILQITKLLKKIKIDFK
jgi:UDP-N-acetylglucosamine 4,6-dehydratase/5-epimerase